MKRERRSAKDVITKYMNELLSRKADKDAASKLIAIETIAFRMGWNDIYDRLRFKKGLRDTDLSEKETPVPWWNR